MKKNKLFIALIVLLSSQTLYPAIIGTLFDEVTTGLVTIKQPLLYFADVKPYVNGGISFTYPAGVYSMSPMTIITLESLVATYTSTALASACVEFNTTTSAMVRVNIDDMGSITEANTNDFLVHFYAVGPKANP